MLLELTSVEKSFADAERVVPVLRGVSLSLAAGETLALTGESGSGKSTLLHIAAGLEAADAGSVRVLSRDLAPMGDAERAALRRRDLALVFQQFNLIPSLSVADNIAFHARLSGQDDPEYAAQITDALGLGAHRAKYPEALSGGQQQRAAIARALVARPKLLLADEPTGNLDEETAETVMAQMRDLVVQTGAGLLVVTHSMKIAGQMDRHVHLSGGVVA